MDFQCCLFRVKILSKYLTNKYLYDIIYLMKLGEDLKAGQRRAEISRVTQLPGPAPAAVPPERLAASDQGAWERRRTAW